MTYHGLYLHTSNRMENLAGQLARITSQAPLSSPLAAETVMTQNPGIARWLSFEIARRAGIALGWDFPLPGKLFQRLLAGFEPDFDERGHFDENAARWILADILHDPAQRPRSALLDNYCSSSRNKTFHFANRLARLFDQYLVYRPDVVVGWEEGPGSTDFQGEIWSRLLNRLFPRDSQPPHIARIWNRLRRAAPEEIAPRTEAWPERLCIFGVSSMPPLYLDLLEIAARSIPVHIFLLQPSDLYWADLRTSTQITRLAQRRRRSGERPTASEVDLQDWIFDTGHPLLPSLGRQGQMFLDLLIDKNPQHDDRGFHAPQAASALAALQLDIFELSNRLQPERDLAHQDQPSLPPIAPDHTLQIHCCSSPRREIEALWDYLVDELNRNPDLQPRDILVMAPDIEPYVPHIEAIFGPGERDDVQIPFSIADRAAARESSLASLLELVLQLPKLSATALDILNIAEQPVARQAFQFEDRDLETIEQWVRELGITWGWDRQHRQALGAFPTDRNTWSECSERLAAGIAMGESALLLCDPAPFAALEGSTAELAGRFLELLEILRQWRNDAQEERPLREWFDLLGALLGKLAPQDDASQRQRLALVEILDEALPSIEGLRTRGQEVADLMVAQLARSGGPSGYLSGRLTFCSLKPMRSIPADTICLIGLNRESFPRLSQRLSFDLLQTEQRIGDRNTSDEDRQIFLEAILSARQRLYLSYQGMSLTSDSPREPSIVLTDLLACLEGDPDKPKFVTRHPRQSYDDTYFVSKNLISYSQRRAAECRARHTPPATSEAPEMERRLAPAPQPRLPSEPRPTLALSELAYFFSNPQRHFATRTLDARWPRDEDQLPVTDSITLDPLQRYAARQAALRAGQPPSQLQAQLDRVEKLLPPGYLRDITFCQVMQTRESIASLLPDPARLELHRLRIELPSAIIADRIEIDRDSACQTIVFPSKSDPKRFLAAWTQHLAFLHLPLSQPAKETRFLFFDDPNKLYKYSPVPQPTETLSALVDLYVLGQVQPPLLFPEIAHQAIKGNWPPPDDLPRNAWEKAILQTGQQEFSKKINGGYRGGGPSFWDEYKQAIWPEPPALGEEFVRQSIAAFVPLFSSLSQERFEPETAEA